MAKKKKAKRSSSQLKAEGGSTMAYDWKTRMPGVLSQHSKRCPVREGGECTCGPLGYHASKRDGESGQHLVSPPFGTLPEALSWQQDQNQRKDDSTSPVDRFELGSLIDDFLQAAEDGHASDLRGQPYAGEDLRRLRGSLSYVDSELGSVALHDVRRRHIQALVNQLLGSGLDPARVVGVVDSLNALYSYAIRNNLVDFSPVVELALPETPLGTQAVGPRTPPPFTEPSDGWTRPPSYHVPGHASGAWPSPPPNGNGSGPLSGMFSAPPASGMFTTPPASGMFTAPPATIPDANYDATMQERWLWWTVRIIVIVFVLIALVLAAESV